METTARTPEDATSPNPIGYIPIKAGHPRWNLAVVLVLVAVILAIALVEAQRLSVGS
jgi:hypothetical protein